jgi:hypothetical protein
LLVRNIRMRLRTSRQRKSAHRNRNMGAHVPLFET